MNRGILIFAHNNRSIDYALMSMIAGALAKKNLNLPVSLVTDQSTIDWMQQSGIYDKAQNIFHKIILTDRPQKDNSRKLSDGGQSRNVPFINYNRNDAYSLTPYDETLLIDSDFLIFSDNLNNYWQYVDKVLIGKSINDIIGPERLGYHDRYVSDTGIHLYWATTIMFKKNDYADHFFTVLNYVKNNYQYFSDLFRFSNKTYRNDIAFSVAQHLIDGFETKLENHLPPVFTTLDTDTLVDVDTEGKLTFILNLMANEKHVASAIKNLDVHVMNKDSLIRNSEKLLGLI